MMALWSASFLRLDLLSEDGIQHWIARRNLAVAEDTEALELSARGKAAKVSKLFLSGPVQEFVAWIQADDEEGDEDSDSDGSADD